MRSNFNYYFTDAGGAGGSAKIESNNPNYIANSSSNSNANS
jgi:hypothetical protein